MKEIIEGFIASNVKSIKLNMCPITYIVAYFKELGWTNELDGNDTNGWQVDFWYYFQKDKKKICLSGSLWYGDFTLEKEY